MPMANPRKRWKAQTLVFACAAIGALLPWPAALAQDSNQNIGNMPGMNMPGMNTQGAATTRPKHRTSVHKKKAQKSALACTATRAEQKPPQQPSTSGMNMNTPGMGHGNAEPPAAGTVQNSMPGMNTANMPSMQMPTTGLFGSYPMARDASGTSWQPDLAEHRGLHDMLGDWMLMGHLTLWGIYDTQSGTRGDDMVFASGMLMGSARRDFSADDLLNFRIMLSPEPFMGRRGYPLLLQTGETANGVTPLVDRQHPHDLFMELSGTYVHKFSPDDSGFLYLGYPGEPALGPPAFMHRSSGMDNPAAPLTHHWLDSTHIDFGVVTAGFVHDNWKLEVSQFTGREPDQRRFDFDKPQFDSTSVRASYNPDQHWSLQASYGHLHSPEQLDPLINEDRFTASAMYVARLDEESTVSAMLAWGLKHLSSGTSLNGVLLESEYKPVDLWTLFARGEWEQNNEIIPASVTADVGELSFGAIRDFRVSQHWLLGAGAQFAFDLTPGRALPPYGTDPHGAMFFVRIAAQMVGQWQLD